MTALKIIQVEADEQKRHVKEMPEKFKMTV